MGAAIYKQSEIARLIAMPKRIAYAEMESPRISRPTPGLMAMNVSAKATNASDSEARFVIERVENDEDEAISITLLGRIGLRVQKAICRYDVQVNEHKNGQPNRRRICGTERIAPRQPHRHIYNARAVEALGPEDWDACAERINLDGNVPFARLKQMLMKAFLDDINAKVESQDQYDELF